MTDKNYQGYNRKEYDRKYRERNRERIREYDRKWRERNREHLREYQKEYRRKKRAERLANE